MKVTLMPGIESISGSMKQKNGKHVVFRTFRHPSAHRSGDKPETRMYLYNYERKTAVTKAERANRGVFAECAKLASQLLREGKAKTKKEAWHIAKDRICK